MKDFMWSMPTCIVFGSEKHLQIGHFIKPFARRVLIHYGSERIEKNGLLDTVKGALEVEGIDCVCLGGVKANPSVALCKEGVEKCRQMKIDTILAIGGGSVIDSAKAISAGVYFDEDLWAVLNRSNLAIDQALNIVSIVTLPATGSEANSVAVISNYETGQKKAISNRKLIPKLAILNPELTYSLSHYQTAVAFIDIFSHCFERYFDLTRESNLWDALCIGTMRSIIHLGKQFSDNSESNQFRDEMMWAATVAHSNMLGPGGDFACHELAHALTILYDVPHGGALALVMPAWCQYVNKKHYERFTVFFKAVFDAESVSEGISQMEAFFMKLGAPMSLKHYYSGEMNISKLIELVYSNKHGYVGNGLEEIYPEDAEYIYAIIESRMK